MSKPRENTATIRSFVLRQGRMTNAQRRALKNHWTQFGLNCEDGLLDPVEVFRDNHRAPDGAALILDIGFGMGDSLHDMALANPHCNFIGIDVHGPGVGHLLDLSAKSGLVNLRVYQHDIMGGVWDCIPDHALSRIQVYFPDPWPKKRHHKRRLINQVFLEHVTKKLIPGDGIFHLITDWDSYAEHIENQINESGGFRRIDKVISRCTTNYEKRALKLGHRIFEFVFRWS